MSRIFEDFRCGALAVFICFSLGFASTRAIAVTLPLPDVPTRQMFDKILAERQSVANVPHLDCTHWVNAVYRRAGLYYPYATSRTLYQGTKEFRRVLSPQAGDLIVWRGHAGIVVDPSHGGFVSSLRKGIRLSSYLSSYWKSRGVPRFFRHAHLIDDVK